MSILETFANAAPANRNLFCAYVPLEDAKGQLVGTYVQGLYQLAQSGQLQCQMESYAYADVNVLKVQNPALYKKLYHLNGTSKTPFELAVLKQINKDDIQNAITKEYAWQNDHIDGVLPQYVFKKYVESEWLANLKLANSKFRMRGTPQALAITVDNFNPKKRDRVIHGAFQAVGFLVTIFSLIGLAIATLPVHFLASLSTVSLVASMAALAVLATFVAKTITLGNISNFFSLAETLSTETPALLSNQFRKTEGILSWSKVATSVGFTLAIGGLSFLAASGVYASTLALPLIAGLGIASPIIAGFLAIVSFLGSAVAASIPVRLLSDSGFGIWDNTIPEKAINEANVLPLNSTKLPPATLANKNLAITASAPPKATRKKAIILDLTEKLKAKASA